MGGASCFSFFYRPLSTVSRGQEVQGTLTLDDAIRLARGNNPSFLSTQNDRGPAEWAVRESYGLFLPDFNTSISGQYLAPGSPSFGIFDAGDLGLAVTDYYFSGYSLTATYSLSGGSFFRVASARADRSATDARIQAASYTLESDVTAQYLIALRARDGVEVARRQLERAEQNFELRRCQGRGGGGHTHGRQTGGGGAGPGPDRAPRGRRCPADREAETPGAARGPSRRGVRAGQRVRSLSTFLGSGRVGGPSLGPSSPDFGPIRAQESARRVQRTAGLEHLSSQPLRFCELVGPGQGDRG